MSQIMAFPFLNIHYTLFTSSSSLMIGRSRRDEGMARSSPQRSISDWGPIIWHVISLMNVTLTNSELYICAFAGGQHCQDRIWEAGTGKYFLSYFHLLHSHIWNCPSQGVHKVQVVAKLGGGFKDQEFHWVRLLDLFYMKRIGTRFSCCQWLAEIE